MKMENCIFIDIFTTQNDLYGKNNCPIQFCCEVFTNEELFDYEKLFNPERRKIFNIIPDEEISIPGFINSGFKTDDIKSSDFNGVELVNALNTIYKLLSTFKNKNFYIIGYTCLYYRNSVCPLPCGVHGWPDFPDSVPLLLNSC
jgi:hypothetical protein